MILNERREIKPLILKFGVALVLSFAGFLFSRLRDKQIKPALPPSSSHISDHQKDDQKGEKAGFEDEVHASPATPTSFCVATNAGEKYEAETYKQPQVSVYNFMASGSPSSGNSGEEDGYRFPEFDELLKDLESSATKACFLTGKDVDTQRLDDEAPRALRNSEKDYRDQEIRHLKNLIRILRYRERDLELQLLEYYGLKEQETAVMELQNRLKINDMEAKLFNIKIESLQADNRRLEAQVGDYARAVSELEAAKEKIKVLKKKLRCEAQLNKEQILTLQERVAKLQDQEAKAAAIDPNVEHKGLETEINELRKSNLMLQQENSDLARRLESTQIIATSVLENPETEALKEQSDHFRKVNEDLTKEIERLQSDRCADVEEVIYLRWINACLRYELRNYQAPFGKTVARDLSKSLSPKSEEKAKQLILKYADIEGADKVMSAMDSDSEEWSSSLASFITDSGECDESSSRNSSANKTNASNNVKFINKLRRIIRGKDAQHNNRTLASVNKAASPHEMAGTYTCESPPSRSSFKPSPFDIKRNQHNEDLKDIELIGRSNNGGSAYHFKRVVLSREGGDSSSGTSQLCDDADSARKSQLMKYAEVLRHSHSGIPMKKTHKKSKSSISC